MHMRGVVRRLSPPIDLALSGLSATPSPSQGFVVKSRLAQIMQHISDRQRRLTRTSITLIA